MSGQYTHCEMQSAIYISIGFEAARTIDKSKGYERGWTEGHIGAMDHCIRAAVLCEGVWDSYPEKDSFSGVYLYEVSEALGAWLYAQGEYVPAGLVEAEALRLIKEAA